jgi:hypothetical protein
MITLIFCGVVVSFLVGFLTGSGMSTRAQDARDRRQAAVQRQLNDEWRVLRDLQEAAEDEMRWASRQQAGLVVIDHETGEEVTYAQREPRRPAPQAARWHA